jgi:aldehyde:ferredoxin oxidoreductase
MRVSDRLLGLPPQTRGANKGRSVDLEPMIKDYWTLFGWDPETGIPSQETIDKLASVA